MNSKNQTHVWVLSADIGGTKIGFAALRLPIDIQAPDGYTVSFAGSIPTLADRGGTDVLHRVCHTLSELKRQVLDEIAETGEKLIGIGIGSAGCIDPHDGSVLSASEILPGWQGIALGSYVSDTLDLPVAVLGDVQAHGLGEARWGAAKDIDSALVVAPGTGLGGAIIINGKIVLGAHGLAGHIGHTLHHRAMDFACSCGRPGHVEPITCGSALAPLYRLFLPDFPEIQDELSEQTLLDIDGAWISRAAGAGDPCAQHTLRFAGEALGEAIGSWCNIFDPAVVILSGSVTRAGEVWDKALRKGFDSQVLEPALSIPFEVARLGDVAPLLGAAEFCMDKLGYRD